MIIVMTILYYFNANAQNIIFNDINFKNRLLTAGVAPNYGTAYTGWANNNGIIDTVIDTNGDLEISYAEVSNITALNVAYANITDLTGLEHFTNLRFFGCDFNSGITVLNLSPFVLLERLLISNTGLGNIDFRPAVNLKVLVCRQSNCTNLNVSGLANLWVLNCANNQVSSVDFSTLPALEYLNVSDNEFTTLDLSNNLFFKDLACENNNLTSINIRNNSQQLFGAQSFYNNCWVGNPNLINICADNFEVSALQNFLSGCGITQNIAINANNCVLNNESFNSNQISVSPNPTKSIVTITFKEFLSEKASYEVYNVLGQKVSANVVQSGVNNFEINLENYANGLYLLQITIGDKKFNKSIIKQ